MLAISLGYPLGVDKGYYMVQRENEIHSLSFKATAVWMQFNGIKVIEDLKEDTDSFETLVAQGLVVKADTLNHLLDGISNAIPIRQGAGSLNGESSAIFLGKNTVCPNSIQSKIWILSDGRKTVAEIYRLLKCEVAVSVDDFILLLSNLDENDLLFFV